MLYHGGCLRKPSMLLDSLSRENWGDRFIQYWLSMHQFSLLESFKLFCCLFFIQILAGRSENMAVPGTLGISHICREVQKQPIGRYQYEEDITILFLKLSWRAIRWNKQYMCQLGVKIVA